MSDEPIDVTPDAGVGSERLAAALATGDADEIGRALRLDVVIIPLVTGADGERQIRVFQPQAADSADGAGSYELALFSSVPALANFLAGDPNREFDVQRGAALTPFLEENRALLGRVVFDPAGPHPVAAPTDAVLAALAPRDDDDLVSWVVPEA